MKKTAGKRHSWVESNVGKIRKPNEKLVNLQVEDLSNQEEEVVIVNKPQVIKLNWYQKLWKWLSSIFY